jgi:hypothetical protein
VAEHDVLPTSKPGVALNDGLGLSLNALGGDGPRKKEEHGLWWMVGALGGMSVS